MEKLIDIMEKFMELQIEQSEMVQKFMESILPGARAFTPSHIDAKYTRSILEMEALLLELKMEKMISVSS